MTTGLFPVRRSESGMRRRQKPRATIIDAFAEELSRHGDVKRAAESLGKSYNHGRQMLGVIRRKLGWQAC